MIINEKYDIYYFEFTSFKNIVNDIFYYQEKDILTDFNDYYNYDYIIRVFEPKINDNIYFTLSYNSKSRILYIESKYLGEISDFKNDILFKSFNNFKDKIKTSFASNNKIKKNKLIFKF